MKLFVWENVLSHWTQGIMFALAHDVDEARRVILKKANIGPYPEIVADALKAEPKVYTQPVGYFLEGGE